MFLFSIKFWSVLFIKTNFTLYFSDNLFAIFIVLRWAPPIFKSGRIIKILNIKI